MQLIKEFCTGCGYCVLVCPYDALATNGWAEVIPSKCTDCNLCVYACPSDCFVPAPGFPLRPYDPPRMSGSYDVTVIGSGLGGLMAGVALSRAGYSVAVFEKLGFPGGRYTEITYRGVPVTTGAWTNLGPNSHIGRFLQEMDIRIDYVSLADAGLPEQYSIRFPDGRCYGSLAEMLPPRARKAWLRAILHGKRAVAEGVAASGNGTVLNGETLERISAAAYVARYCADPDLLALVDASAATASGLSSQQLPASEYIQITLDGRTAGREFAMPRGGVRAIIDALVTALRQAGGALFVRSPVSRIVVQGGRAIGIDLDSGRTVRSRFVLHNGGVRQFIRLAGTDNLPPAYAGRLAKLKGVECAALFCATRQPLFTEAPITMTPNCRRVVGIFSPTVLDPEMSGTGLHLYDAFLPTYSADRTAELELALADLRDLFPNFDEVVEWQVPMFFTGAWPGTETGQTFGQTGDRRLEPVTPLDNCFLVGMDVQGSGVAGDLIPLGVRRALEMMEAIV